ncbi:MAG TPA: glutathione peroxidase, partial [Flavisolibacter sp.]|nr:glutathione peroxidase [Flavisolibacter sp.]
LTTRQQILKWIYPLFVWYKKRTGENKKIELMQNITPSTPFYNLSALLYNGSELPFDHLKGKKVLIVNTASNCGYTNQYTELQELYEKQKEKLLVLAFPSNDFKEQEKGTDEEIAQFCQLNFGVTFPLAKKSVVIKGEGQNKVFEWLTHKELNGWNEQPPSWNFSKYLVNEQGILTHYFDPAVSPCDAEILKAINS